MGKAYDEYKTNEFGKFSGKGKSVPPALEPDYVAAIEKNPSYRSGNLSPVDPLKKKRRDMMRERRRK